MKEFEVEMTVINALTRKHEHKWDYVMAEDEAEAKSKITWKYGNAVDFISVSVFE